MGEIEVGDGRGVVERTVTQDEGRSVSDEIVASCTLVTKLARPRPGSADWDRRGSWLACILVEPEVSGVCGHEDHE